MTHLNVEFKARNRDDERVREVLQKYSAKYIGLDRQVDTYFNAGNGRLKLREGNLENNLIHYLREDIEGPKSSIVNLYPVTSGSSLKEILTNSLGIEVVVDKKREIYFIGNVKIHIDEVVGLGNFIEVEAIDINGHIGKDRLEEQCELFKLEFCIDENDLISCSYSDLLKKEIRENNKM